MKAKVALAAICLMTSAENLAAQSGRRIEARPSNPSVIEARDAEPDYSESTPQPKRPKSPIAMREAMAKTAASPKAATTAPDEQGEEVTKIDTSLITIPVSVFDRNGLYISGLQQGDFRVFEDGQEQAITYFGSTDQPFTVALLLDTSPSTEYRIEQIREAAIAFVNQLKPQDQVIVIEFDGNERVLSEATSDRERLIKAIKKADFGYNTSLYDTVDFALTKRLNKITGRKAIVLFTDGVDTASHRSTYDKTLDLAEESDTLIFPIYYNTFAESNSAVYSPFPGQVVLRPSTAAEYAVGRKYLEDLASYTGGRIFRPESTPGGLINAFAGIAEELRRQYSIGYIPADDGSPGQRKQIKVRVNRPKLVVRARDSYIVGATAESTPPAGKPQK